MIPPRWLGGVAWLTAGLALASNPAPAAERYWDQAMEQHLLLRRGQPGAQRYGFTFYGGEEPSQEPGRPIGNAGWYKLAESAGTPFWEDKNGNGGKDDGEVRQVRYWLYYLTTVDCPRVLLTDMTDAAATYRSGFAYRGEQDGLGALAVSAGDRCLVVDGRAFIEADRLTFWTNTVVYLATEPGTGPRGVLTPTSWTPGPQWLDGAAINRRIGELYAGPCGQVSRSAAQAMAASWNGWLGGTRLADGPCVHGLWPKSLECYLPTRGEYQPDMIWSRVSPGYLPGVRLRRLRPSLQAEAVMGAFNQKIWEGPVAVVAEAHAEFAKQQADHRGMAALTLPGADEAAHVVDKSSYVLVFRLANVVGEVTSYSATEEPAAAGVIARELATRMLAKLTGGTVPSSELSLPKNLFPRARAEDTYGMYWVEGTFRAKLFLEVNDPQGRPAPNAGFVVKVEDPAMGELGAGQVTTDAQGQAMVTYRPLIPGRSTVTFTHPQGQASVVISQGGLRVDVSRTRWQGPLAGTVEVVVTAVHPRGDALAGVAVTLAVDDSALPARGSLDQSTRITDAQGQARFTYTPPPEQAGARGAGMVGFKAEAMMGNAPRLVRTEVRSNVVLVPPTGGN